MGTNCAPLLLICFYFAMRETIKETRYDIIEASRYLDDHNIHFEQMVHRIYPAELQLNKAIASDTE